MKLLIYAPRIRSGGGWILLRELGRVAGIDCQFIVDSRLNVEQKALLPSGTEFWNFRGISTLFSDWRLKARAKNFDAVLCMGNVAPLFSLNRPTLVYVQNLYVLKRPEGLPFSLSMKSKRWWFKITAANASTFLVQTNSMARLILDAKLAGRLSTDANVLIKPFRDIGALKSAKDSSKKWDFLYVATSEPHKNHRRLLDAWKILADEGVLPTLALTLSKSEILEMGLSSYFENTKCKIELLGKISTQEVLDSYSQARFYIQPSFFESFGLPLLEAASAGVPIVAPELDYVRDVIEPVQTFDPMSPVSMARAVKRAMSVGEVARVHPSSTADFLAEIFKMNLSK